MQEEKEMGKGKGVNTVLGQEGGDRHTYGLTDQATRLLEFHMLYGTNKRVEQ